MARGRLQRFTIYDALEHKGYFDSNPANIDARDSEGTSIFSKAEYPKMLYHPDGLEDIVVPAEAVATPFGPKWVGEQRALQSRIVGSVEEERAWVAQGWHTHPAKSIAAAGRPMPDMGPGVMAIAKDAEIEDLRRQIKLLRSQQAPGQRASDMPAPGVGPIASAPSTIIPGVLLPSEPLADDAPAPTLSPSHQDILAREVASQSAKHR